MSLETTLHSNNYFRAFPKVDLHRHLEGSLRLRTLVEVGRSHGLGLPNTNQLRGLVQIDEGEPLTFENFLSKFQTLRLFYRSPEVIDRVAREAIADAAADNVRYMELRFTPAALSKAENFPFRNVIEWVVTSANEAAREHGIMLRLIVSVNRNESIELATDVIRTASDFKDQGLVGVDLAGDEANFSGLLFSGIFQEAKQSGMYITVHAGEWGPARNVKDAIQQLGADRIGHGVRVLEDPIATALARERQIPFEVCVTSNYQSGVVPTLNAHPLPRMLTQGLNVTINTDDPSISQITLSDEYRRTCKELGLSIQALGERVLAAANAAFLPADERQQLAARIKGEIQEFK
jgi:adenosine deaminase